MNPMDDKLREYISSGENVLVNTVIILRNLRAILTDRQYWLDSTVENLKMENPTFMKISRRSRRQGFFLAPVDRYHYHYMDKNWKIIQLIQPEIPQV